MKPATTRQAGYTIIEVMIFLVVSGALLGSALALFNGRIQKTQFTQSVQALDTRIKTIANEVATGTYPAQPTFNCTAVGPQPVISASAGEQGTRGDCIFLGKIINFMPLSSDKIEVYTVVGKRADASGNASATMAAAAPRLVINPPTPIELTESVTLDYGTHVTGLYQSGPTLVSGLGLFQSLNSTYNTSGNLSSGAQNVAAWVIKSTSVPAAPVNAANINTTVTGGNAANFFALSSGQDLHLCLKSGNDQQKASITFKGSGNSMKTAILLEDPQCP
jgi:type II secretory pathway pseudopilin PulG